MKILLIHRYFWPDHPNCGNILWNLTKHFGSEGHQIDVLTSLPSKNLNSKKILSKKKEKFQNINIKRINLSIENNNPIKKIINGLYLGFWTNFLAIKKNYDIIISTTIPPITGGFFAAFAAYINKIRFIYFCMDLQPEVGRVSKDFSNPFFYSILRKIDNWSCKIANPIVVHSSDMKNSLLLRDRANKFNIEIINNFSIPSEKHNKTILKKNFCSDENKLKIIFAGNLGRFQSLHKIIEAMILLKERKDIELIIVGDGSIKAELISKIKKNNINVKIFDQEPIHVVKEMIQKSDIGLVSLCPNIYKYGYPGKIMTYLEQGKPIIAILEKESEIVRLMEQENYGFSAPSLDPKKISQLFIKLAENNSWKIEMNRNALSAYEKHFSRNKILNKWSKLL